MVADGFASPIIEVTREVCRRRTALPVRMFPTLTAGGEVRVPRGYDRPEIGHIRVYTERDDPAEPEVPFHDFPVHLGESARGKWRASIPRVEEKSLRIPGFLPVLLERGAEDQIGLVDYGVQTLRPAATLIARLVPASGGRTAELFPAATLEALVNSEFMAMGDKPEPAATGSSDEAGWLRLDGLEPGAYRLSVYPVEGGPPTLSELLDIQEGEKLLIDPLQVPEPASVVVSLSSPLLQLDGYRIWVALAGSSACDWKSRIYKEVDFDDLGTARLGPLPSGTWLLQVSAENEAGEPTTLLHATVELEPGTTKMLEVEAEAAVYNGTVSSLGQPVQAELTVRDPASGFELASTLSDESGHFSALIPEAGVFDVTVRGTDAASSGQVAGVGFEDPKELVEIELPNAEIRGLVLDAAGTAVTGASITAQSGRGLETIPLTTAATTSSDGSFALPRLSEGSWQLQAARGEARSEIMEIELSEGEIVPGVVLRLAAGLQIQGRLLVAGQPVSGASLFTSCLWLPPTARCGGFVTTDESGRFVAPFGPGSQKVPVNVILRDRGLPWTPFKVWADPHAPEREITLNAPANGGSLEILLRASSAIDIQRAVSGMVLFHEDGGFIPVGFGMPQPPGPDSTRAAVVFGGLAPGNWQLHRLQDESNFVQFASRGVQPRVLWPR